MKDITTLPELVQKKILVHPSGCWVWTASTSACGYGRAYVDRHHIYAHRLVYSILVEGNDILLNPGCNPAVELDHTCRNKRCVNPEHLDPVSHRVNSSRRHGGRIGARFVPRERRFVAYINLGGVKCHLGYFDDDESALVAYDASRFLVDGETPNHERGITRKPNAQEIEAARLRLDHHRRRLNLDDDIYHDRKGRRE